MDLHQTRVTLSQQQQKLAETVSKLDALALELDNRRAISTFHGNGEVLKMLKKDLECNRLQNAKREQLLALHKSNLIVRQRDIDFLDQQISYLKEIIQNKNHHPHNVSLFLDVVTTPVFAVGESNPMGVFSTDIAHHIGMHLRLKSGNYSTVARQQLSAVSAFNGLDSVTNALTNYLNQSDGISSGTVIINPSCDVPNLHFRQSQKNIHDGFEIDSKCMYASKSVIASTYLSKRPVIVATVDHTMTNVHSVRTGYQSTSCSHLPRPVCVPLLDSTSHETENQFEYESWSKHSLFPSKIIPADSSQLSKVIGTSSVNKAVQVAANIASQLTGQMSLPDASHVCECNYLAVNLPSVNTTCGPVSSFTSSEVSNRLYKTSKNDEFRQDDHTESDRLWIQADTARKAPISCLIHGDAKHIVEVCEVIDGRDTTDIAVKIAAKPATGTDCMTVTLPQSSVMSSKATSALMMSSRTASQSYSVKNEKDYVTNDVRKTSNPLPVETYLCGVRGISLVNSGDRQIVSPRPVRRRPLCDMVVTSRHSILPQSHGTVNSSYVHPSDTDNISESCSIKESSKQALSSSSPSSDMIEHGAVSVVLSSDVSAVRDYIEVCDIEFVENNSLNITSFDNSEIMPLEGEPELSSNLIVRTSKSRKSTQHARRVTFSPLALLLDAALEGDLDLVKTASKLISSPSIANDEGITALHNAVCAGHYDVASFLVGLGCDVNAADGDGWTPLHCAASCGNLKIVKLLVEYGAAVFAKTMDDDEIAIDKCEKIEGSYDAVHEYLSDFQSKFGVVNDAVVYAVYNYDAMAWDELSFKDGDELIVIHKDNSSEKEWWFCQMSSKEGYVPRNYIAGSRRTSP